jgi:hypothetical protein
MGIFSAGGARVLVLLALLTVATFAAEMVVITDAQIARLAQQFGPIAKPASPPGGIFSPPPSTKSCRRAQSSIW